MDEEKKSTKTKHELKNLNRRIRRCENKLERLFHERYLLIQKISRELSLEEVKP